VSRFFTVVGALAAIASLACSDGPTEPGAPGAFVSVAVGQDHSCAVTTAGRIHCWGRGASGELGDGQSGSRATLAPVAGGRTYTEVTAGQRHSCALTDEGEIYCWGWNDFGQLGDGSTFTQAAPVVVASPLRFSRVEAGWLHTCGLAAEGRVLCWGSNGQGQLGDGGTATSLVPVPVGGNLRFTTLSAGAFHSCAVAVGGAAYCWGLNHTGQLGNGTARNALTPTRVVGADVYRRVSAGFSHSCGVTTGLAVRCWGENAFGELGNTAMGSPGVASATPTPVFRGQGYTEVSVGLHYSCGVTSGRAALCWGAALDGQLGDPRLVNNPTPQVIEAPDRARLSSVRAGPGIHTCGIADRGALYCWGRGEHGELGTGDTTFSPTPVRVELP
jgi:alpha-tubulin suppressor-like RCC1 family protein